MNLTIRGGRLALPDAIVEGDLQIEDGKITRLGTVERDLGEVIDARGLLVMPGVIDPQVHFRDPGLTHKEDLHTGSRACLAGGVTSYLEMPNTKPSTTTLETMAAKKARALEVSCAHYGFFIGATPHNLEVLNAVEQVCGIKVFMGSSTGDLLVNERGALENIFAHGRRLIAVHAEDEARLLARKAAFGPVTDVALHSELRDAESARLASALALELSERYQRRLHILHLTTKDEVELLRARGKGAGRVTAEVTPQHLTLHAPDIYARIGTKAQMNPPLRSAEHAAALWAGLKDGTLDCIATDHAPHTLEEKAQPYGASPSGMPGVETALPVMLDAAHRGLCRVEDVVRWMTDGPRRCYGIVGKGRLQVGADGDLALVDLAKRARVGDRPYQTKVGWNPFEGTWLTGWPVMTILLGQVAMRDGAIDDTVRGRALLFRDGE